MWLRKDYPRKALASPAMRRMISEKTEIGLRIFKARTRKGHRTKKSAKGYVPGANARMASRKVTKGGIERDRWVGYIYSNSDHALTREFGNSRNITRGGEYTEFVAKRYKRDAKTGRALGVKKGATPPEHLLGGRNGRLMAFDGAQSVLQLIGGRYKYKK